MKLYAGISLIFVVVLLTACSAPAVQNKVEIVGQTVSVEGGTYTDVSAAEMQTMLVDKDFTFINVHIPFQGDIPSTDLSIPYDQFDQNLDELPADKGAKIVVYCRSGYMSAIAAQTLISKGYTNIWNLSGGMVAWEQAGLPIDR